MPSQLLNFSQLVVAGFAKIPPSYIRSVYLLCDTPPNDNFMA